MFEVNSISWGKTNPVLPKRNLTDGAFVRISKFELQILVQRSTLNARRDWNRERNALQRTPGRICALLR